jgi:hypothetical protein
MKRLDLTPMRDDLTHDHSNWRMQETAGRLG